MGLYKYVFLFSESEFYDLIGNLIDFILNGGLDKNYPLR